MSSVIIIVSNAAKKQEQKRILTFWTFGLLLTCSASVLCLPSRAPSQDLTLALNLGIDRRADTLETQQVRGQLTECRHRQATSDESARKGKCVE